MTRLAGPAAAVFLAAAGLACRPRASSVPPSSSSNAKLDEVRSILASRNDNDPRLDTDFNALSDGDKRAFMQAYAALPREKRNERGTFVYLVGKNAATPEDWAFLEDAAAEPPCLSLSDCGKSGAGGGEPGDAVTLAYPALVALKSAERALDAGKDRPRARAVIDAGLASRAPAVRRLAQRLASKK